MISSALSKTHFPPSWCVYTTARDTAVCWALSHLCLTDNFVELCLPACIANAATAKAIVPKELSKEQTVYERPCTIFYSTLFNAQGAIPWSQKSFEIFVPLSGWCSGDKSFMSASVHLSSWVACLSFICAVLDRLCLVTGSFCLCQEQPSEQTHYALLSLLRLPQHLWRTPHTPSVII